MINLKKGKKALLTVLVAGALFGGLSQPISAASGGTGNMTNSSQSNPWIGVSGQASIPGTNLTRHASGSWQWRRFGMGNVTSQVRSNDARPRARVVNGNDRSHTLTANRRGTGLVTADSGEARIAMTSNNNRAIWTLFHD